MRASIALDSCMSLMNSDNSGLRGRLRHMITWSLVGQVTYILSQFAILVLLTRFSSVEDVGRFGLATAITAPVFFFFQLGLRFNQATDATDEFGFADFFSLRLISTLGALVVIASVAALTLSDTTTLWILGLFTAAKAVEMQSDLMYGVFQKHGNLRLVAASLVARGVSSTLTFAMVLILGGTPVYAFASYFFTWLAVFIFLDLPRARRLEGSGRRRASPAEIWRLARNSAPLGVAGLLANLSTSLPRLVLAQAAGLEQLGYFTSVAYVYQGFNMMVQSMNQAIIGRLARYWVQGRVNVFRSVMMKLSLILMSLSLVAALVLVPYGGDLLGLVFGADYRSFGNLLVLMVIAFALNVPMTVHQTGLMAQRRFSAQLANRGIFAGLVGIFCLTGIAVWGLEGAALGMAAASLVQSSLVVILVRKAAPKHERPK